MTIVKTNENNSSCLGGVSFQGYGLLVIQLFEQHLFTSKKPVLDKAPGEVRMNSSKGCLQTGSSCSQH